MKEGQPRAPIFPRIHKVGIRARVCSSSASMRAMTWLGCGWFLDVQFASSERDQHTRMKVTRSPQEDRRWLASVVFVVKGPGQEIEIVYVATTGAGCSAKATVAGGRKPIQAPTRALLLFPPRLPCYPSRQFPGTSGRACAAVECCPIGRIM